MMAGEVPVLLGWIFAPQAVDTTLILCISVAAGDMSGARIGIGIVIVIPVIIAEQPLPLSIIVAAHLLASLTPAELPMLILMLVLEPL